MKSRFLLILVLSLLLTGVMLMPGHAERSSGVARPVRSLQGLTPIWSRAVGFAESPPLRTFPVKNGPTVDEPFKHRSEEDEAHEINDKNTEGTGAEPNPNVSSQRDTALQTTVPAKPLIPSPSLTFEGLSAADNTAVFGTTVAPPDPNIAVGPNDVVETTNTLVRVYDKNGVPRGPAFKLSSLFAALGGVAATKDQGDPIVLYDRMANRWLISQFAFASQTSPPYHQVIAISKNSDPTGSYWVYDFITPGAEFPDYPKFGAWPDGYYYTDRQFTNGGPFNSFGCIAFDRTKMLVGDPTASFIYFNLGSPLPRLSNASSGMIPTDFNGITPPPPGSPNVFAVYTDNQFTGDANDAVRLFNFHADFASPGLSTFTERSESPLLVAGFDSRNPSGRADIEEPPPAAGGDSLDSIGDRLLLRMQYMNRGGVETFTTCHTVNGGTIPAPGVLPTRAQYRAAMRYYIFQKTSPGGALTVPEQSTFAPADTSERWMGSSAIDNAGNLAVGYSVSSITVFPSLAYAGRLSSDPPNSLAQGEATMFTGTGAQIATQNRWGDYTALQLDPSDDATFWYVNQYYATSPAAGFDWHTRIGRFKFATTSAPAQGTLNGTVTACDTGLPLADALVQVTGGPSTGFSAATMANGSYSMNLAPGDYQVTIGDPAHNCNAIGPVAVTITNGGTTTQNGCLSGIPKFAFISSSVSGGDGDGTIEPNECNDVNVTIQNIGCVIASNVTAMLSTSTANVTITQPNTTFPTMNENVNGTTQVAFSVSASPGFVCGTPINFTLMVASPLGGSISLPFTLPSCVLPPTTINGSLTAGDLQQNARLGRNGIASACGTNKANPGTLGTGNRSYDLYTFVNGPTATCVKIDLTPTCSAATNPIISVAYLNAFNPADITQNYRGDPGGSPNTGATASFSVDVPANATLLVNVHEINQGTGCSGYTLTVSGLIGNGSGAGPCVACSITCPANVTSASTTNQCGAVVSYPAPMTTGTCGAVSCSPASGSFFPVGTTTVTCTTSGGPACSFTVTINDTQPPSITCPANITVSNTPNQCSAVVNYPAPTVSDNCPGVGMPVCSPASGSSFPVGTTTVSCSVSDAAQNTATCSFTITVNDTQAPTITCPSNITAVTNQNACPAPLCQVVTFSTPTASDNCPGVSVVCAPPSGSCLPTGVSTVTCTATDASGNQASCSFAVQVFDTALQDDSNPGNILLWNSLTGAYRFCCNGITFTGVGKSTVRGCVYTLETPTAFDRRILGRVDKAVHSGNASLQAPPGTTRCTITDRNTLNNVNLASCQ